MANGHKQDMMTEQVRRAALQLLRSELESEAAEIRAEHARLERTQEYVALRAHAERLKQHIEHVHGYGVALHRFHEEFGPLG
jgi:hypothetical protein